MLRLELSLTNQRGETLFHHRFEVPPDLAHTFLTELASLLATLPVRPRISKDRSRTVIDFSLAPTPPVQPSFETRFRKVFSERTMTDDNPNT